MAAVTRQGDISAGHGYPPRPNDQGSPDVFVDNLPVHRQTDHWPTHCIPGSCHDGVTLAGNPTVFVNNLPIARIGDPISCGDKIAQGSQTVFAGENTPSPAIISILSGVTSIGPNTVYSNDSHGITALVKDEETMAPGITNEKVYGDVAEPIISDPILICNTFTNLISDADMATPVSKYFTLAHAKMIPIAQRGLTAGQIACNWAKLCVNTLDPIYNAYKFIITPTINSGFRTLSYNRSIGSVDTSDHCIGCAADISMGDKLVNIEMFKWILSSGIPFSQIIFEGHWIHVSFGGSPKGHERVMYTFTGSNPIAAGNTGSQLPKILHS